LTCLLVGSGCLVAVVSSLSFVRLLSGLWPVRKGTVIKEADVFCVPQRIYMTLGTLAEQITYPQTIMKHERTAEIEAQLQKLLDLVGIGYLVSRWGGDADGVIAKVSQPASQLASQPASNLASQPATQPASNPASSPVSQSLRQSLSQSLRQSLSQSLRQPVVGITVLCFSTERTTIGKCQQAH
jgi:hypothetical protein